MSKISIGSPVPDISLPATGEKNCSPAQFAPEKAVVVYFYPKDSTPGCTTEGLDFSTHYAAFQAADVEIVGVSKDSMRRHENFKAKQGFPFDLISDEEEQLCQAFDVIKLKKNFGKEYMGIERSTFLIDKSGVLRQEWRKVKVKGHVEEVLAAAKAL